MTKKTRAKARRVLLTLSLVLVVAFAAVGGTLAWLTDNTQQVKNTFSPAGVEINLTETMNTDTNNDGKFDSWTAQLIPGKTYEKDPYVHVIRNDTTDKDGKVVKGTDVDIYLFVKFEERFDENVLTYASNLNEEMGWKQVPSTDNVWYRVVEKGYNEDADDNADNGVSFQLLHNNIVSINGEKVTKDKTNVGGTMIYTAYAIQTEGFANYTDDGKMTYTDEQVKQAWEKAQSAAN